MTMTLESPEEIQDVSCAWKELNRKLSSNAVSQITRMCLLKGNMVGFLRQLPYMFIKTNRFCSFFFLSLMGWIILFYPCVSVFPVGNLGSYVSNPFL